MAHSRDPTELLVRRFGGQGGLGLADVSKMDFVDLWSTKTSDDLLEYMFELWVGVLPSAMEASLIQGLKVFGVKHGKTLTVGSICSGSDIAGVVMEAFSRYMRRTHNVDFVSKHKFQCEINEEKRKHLMQHGPRAECVFMSADEMKETLAFDVVTSAKKVVPSVDIFTCGWPCLDRTPASSAASSMTGCVRRAEGRTGGVFRQVWEYITGARPLLVIMENVTGLCAQDPGHQD